MLEFLFEYGLFAAKSITIIGILVFGLVMIISSIANRPKPKEYLEIDKLNEKYEDLKSTLEEEIIPKEELKELEKARKKKEKLKAKAEKKKAKEKYKNIAKEQVESKSSDDSNDSTIEPVLDKERVFVIRFDGDMHASEVDLIRESISAILQIANKKDEVLFVLESGGGIVHNYGLAASQLHRIKDHGIKLTIAVDLVAASGGYMMACVADKIIAAPFAVVGSIGVLAQVPNFHRLLDKHDIDIEHHTAGQYKTTLTMLGKNTDKERKKFQEELEDTHVLFKNFVKQNRSQLDIEKIATGEHWYATQALELNLIDEIKTSDDYILDACKKKDVFEVSYKFHETFKDKVSSVLELSLSKTFSKIWHKLSSKAVA